jgi:hypothetical protein
MHADSCYTWRLEHSVGQNRSFVGLAKTVYKYTVYDRIFGDFHAKNTVRIYTAYGFWPTLFTRTEYDREHGNAKHQN